MVVLGALGVLSAHNAGAFESVHHASLRHALHACAAACATRGAASLAPPSVGPGPSPSPMSPPIPSPPPPLPSLPSPPPTPKPATLHVAAVPPLPRCPGHGRGQGRRPGRRRGRERRRGGSGLGSGLGLGLGPGAGAPLAPAPPLWVRPPCGIEFVAVRVHRSCVCTVTCAFRATGRCSTQTASPRGRSS